MFVRYLTVDHRRLGQVVGFLVFFLFDERNVSSIENGVTKAEHRKVRDSAGASA